MKNLITLFLAVLTAGYLFGQAVQRNQVVMEIGTGTWCTYCPGAANGAHDLLVNGKQVAVIENHNGDAFANTYSNARNNFYGITGFPTAFFDGISSFVGGQACPNGNVYSSYLPIYNARYAVLSPLVIDISGTNVGNDYDVIISIKKLANITATDLRLQFVLTESNITTSAWPPVSGGYCMTSVSHVNRLMVPDENGTVISFASGDFQVIELTFTKDPAWVAANCELVAFIQDNTGHEALNGSKVALNALPLPVSVNFTGNPTTGCAPQTVNYTDQSAGVNAWQWNLPGGTPSTSTVQNPAISYTTAGTYDATLTAWNSTTNRGNKKVKTGYLTINSVPPAPGTPVGSTSMCVSPPPQTYTTTGATSATSYTWDLQPAAAGTLTPGGLSCVVNFNTGWTGTATLKVQGTSSCGTGAWSPPLSITLNQPPVKPGTPAGPSALCENPPNSDYTTTGSTGATSYAWDLNPTTAGTITSNGTTATVNWANSYIGSAQLKVIAYIGGCEGPWSDPFTVNISTAPVAHNVTGGGPYCQGGAGVPVGLDGSQTSTNYTLYLNVTTTITVVPGNGGPITFGNQTQAGTYTVVADPAGSTNCSTNMNGNAIVTIDPQVPSTPATPTGPAYPESGSTVNYTTTGAVNATSYSWTVTPASAGIFTGNTTTGTITFSPTFTGAASIQVKGVNSCGESAIAASLNIDVVAVGIAEPTKEKFVSVYPNPAKGFLNLVPVRNMKAEIRLLNSIGSTVMTIKEANLTGTYKLDLSIVNPGVYFIMINVDDAQQINKVIVE